MPQFLRNESSDEEEVPDFDYLLKFKPSVDSHLILKSDQRLFDTTELTNHFQIDKNLLNLSMLSIPFNERHEIEGVNWRSDELLNMQKISDHHRNKLNEKISQISSDQKRIYVSDNIDKVRKDCISEQAKNLEIPKSQQKISSPKSEKEDIQNWLDDVLEI